MKLIVSVVGLCAADWHAQNQGIEQKTIPNLQHYDRFHEQQYLLKKGDKDGFDEEAAREIHPNGCHPANLLAAFTSIYADYEERRVNGMDVAKALFRQERRRMTSQVFWAVTETFIRLATPFVLREFLIWLEDYRHNDAEVSEGWMWGIFLAVSSVSFMLVHHRHFWNGVFVGYRMRSTLMTAIHAKLLKLNASSIARITTGHVVSLLSNDVRRLEQASVLWPYLLLGPLEAVFALAAVSFVLGFVPAIAGMSCILVIIPIQVLISKSVAYYRSQIAEKTDERVGLTGELVSGILAVKMLGWEEPLIRNINNIRSEEHNLIQKKNLIVAAKVALPVILHAAIVGTTFITFRFTSGTLNVPDVFFALSLMSLPRLTLAYFFVGAVQMCSEAFVTCKRTDAFLKLPQPSSTIDISSNDDHGHIKIDNGNFGVHYSAEAEIKMKEEGLLSQARSKDKCKKQNQEDRASSVKQLLRDINLSIQPGELVGLAGIVGSGKSSLLAALLNDIDAMPGTNEASLSGHVAFCSQTPWILSGTVRENILFGRPFDEERYQQAIESCALTEDLRQWPNGDRTELGERGVNISGGQKARLALARAAYSPADIQLLDDPLSSVDPMVGRALFERCIGQNGLMRNSTRILVTHQRKYLQRCDRVVFMANGAIQAAGPWQELEANNIVDLAADETDNKEKGALQQKDPAAMEQPVEDMTPTKTWDATNVLSSDDKQICGADRLVVAEARKTGEIGCALYWKYMNLVGLVPFTAAMTTMTISMAALFLGEWWLAQWASADDDEQEESKWVWGLAGFTFSGGISNLITVFILFALLMAGSTRLHSRMINTVVHAPLSFFHTHPTGRILNRFAKDLGLQDEELPNIGIELFRDFLMVLGMVVVVAIALPYMLIALLPLVLIFWRFRQRYVRTSREVKRFDGVTRSPVYETISANIKGLATIRAFRSEDQFQNRFMEVLDHNGTWWTSFLITSRWIGFRMDGISALVMIFSVLLAMLLADDVPINILAQALTYIISLSGLVQWAMRQSAELENTMTAVERNIEYTNLEQEGPTTSKHNGDVPVDWPNKGEIVYDSVTAAYRAGLDPVLKRLSFKIPGGSSVGIVGRTGSGKSSLLLALFRLIDINEGAIKIDGVNVAPLAVDVLRKQLAVIPQDPVLFGGTIRLNLDPWREHSDAKLWNVLNQICLESIVKNHGGLDARITECGNNFSTGQRQLFCLARALLMNARVLSLDEATANVDRGTDFFIQKSIRSIAAAKDRTLLIIAHRIETVADCDLILVLDNGEVAEFGPPSELIQRRDGHFAGMAGANSCEAAFSGS